jgi:hypothetical protein
LGILVNIVAAEEDELEDVGSSLQPLDTWSGIERRELDIAKFVTLHCLLTGDEFDLAATLYEPVFVSDEGAWVLRIDDAALDRLVNLEEHALTLVAEELAATETFEYEGWPEEEVLAFVLDLGDLARLAESQGQVLFVWMHPLMT